MQSKVNSLKYYEGLDVLRAFAVCFVIITHWGPSKFKSEILTFIFQKIIPDGLFGVDLFFVLSGFLITSILLNAKDNANGNRMTIIKSFYIRRALRIFPIYYLLIAIVYLLNDQSVKDHLIYYLSYTSNFLVFELRDWGSISHTWSLAVEEQFYLIWPWIIIFIPQKHLLKFIVVFLLIGILSTVILGHKYISFFYVLTPTCFTAFAIGAIGSYLQKYPELYLLRLLKFALPVSIVFYFLNQFGYQIVLIRLFNAIIAINLIFYVVAEKYNIASSYILKNKLLIEIGKISYGIYLYHFITPSYYLQFIDFINKKINFTAATLRILKNPPPAYLIQLAIVGVVSLLSYSYIETNFIKLKHRFKYIANSKRN